ncbi:pyridoxamine 5'-phosphate oxidase family protein [soil metagenome]
MGIIKKLDNSEGIKKIKEIAEDIRVCMFCTGVDSLPFETRPMSTLEVDEQGNFWFFSSIDSNKNLEIVQDDQVQLIYSKASDSHFMSVYGRAEISKDRKKIEQLWNGFAKAWFKDGKADPQLSVICIKPEQAYYWDTQHGHMVSLLKIAIAAISDKQMDDGVEGEILVK